MGIIKKTFKEIDECFKGITLNDILFSIYNTYYDSERKKEVREHRIIIEKALGRKLKQEETIHHINGVKDDNRLINLKLCKNQKEHFKYHKKYSLLNIFIIRERNNFWKTRSGKEFLEKLNENIL